MKVRILIGAQAAYACLSDPNYSMDVRLEPGRSPSKSLRESADELRAKSEHLLIRASRMEQAAAILEG